MKTITNNSRSNNQFGVLHLFEFEMYTFAGSLDETLRFTDADIFVNDGTNEYTPLSILIDKLSENGSMQSDSIGLTIDNISGALTSEALASEWRNNKAKITRVIYTPPSDTIGTEVYEYGYGDNLDTYPKVTLTSITKDSYVLFDGIIDTFSASESSLSATLTSQFTHWAKPYPTRTYNQNEFDNIIEAITETLYWGRNKEV